MANAWQPLEPRDLAAVVQIQYLMCMKMITINVEEQVYRRFQDTAARGHRSASELIREAMVEYAGRMIPQERSIFDDPPARVGTIYDLAAEDDDLLGEMLS
jgi:Arc/MetJ-type ribon-helix-helix transcriptional regulator